MFQNTISIASSCTLGQLFPGWDSWCGQCHPKTEHTFKVHDTHARQRIIVGALSCNKGIFMDHSKHFGLLTPNATLIEHQKSEGHVDQTDMEFDKEDAQLVLEAAQACQAVCCLKQELAKAHCVKSGTLLKLYKYWANGTKKRHDHTEFDLDVTQDAVTSNPNTSDMSVVCRANTKHPHMLSSPAKRDHTVTVSI